MADIINFPTESVTSTKEIKSMLENIDLPLDVDVEKWEQIAVPKILKLLVLPDFNHSFTIGEIDENQTEALKNDLTKSIKDYVYAIQMPLIAEIAKLYIELCKNT